MAARKTYNKDLLNEVVNLRNYIDSKINDPDSKAHYKGFVDIEFTHKYAKIYVDVTQMTQRWYRKKKKYVVMVNIHTGQVYRPMGNEGAANINRKVFNFMDLPKTPERFDQYFTAQGYLHY